VTPLYAKRTNDKYGVIINANVKTEENKISIKSFYNRPPTKILMITNMVYPEEINCETYTEISTEFETCGSVIDVKFFHFHDCNLPIGESVRIFIEYER
jgi:hypothetical protein